MKRFSLILLVLCSAWFAGCNKDDDGGKNPQEETSFTLKDGSIVINNHPDVTIKALSEFPEGKSTVNEFSASKVKSGLKLNAVSDPTSDELKANDYRFKLVAEMSTLKIDNVAVQATHVKITDDYAFVSYNEKGDPHRGGVVVYKFVVHDGALEDVTVDVTAVASLQMSKAEVSAIDYYNGKLYLTGASSDPVFGYQANTDGYNYAFFMVMELNADMTFKNVDPQAITKLTSFQGTSIRATNDRVFITTGDGTNGTDGGLYIYNATDYTLVRSILGKDHARSVDVDVVRSTIFLMQAEPARVTIFDFNGGSEKAIYTTTNEAMQKDAKSEIVGWDKYLFVAENESGLRMLLKDNGDINAQLDRPGENPETEVTNSAAMNSDLKKNFGGDDIQSNLLLLANGEKGVYWYDIINSEDKDWIVAGKDNSILGGNDYGSANFIASKGNIVFVADGEGGLKVLYVGFNNGVTPPPLGSACDAFMPYLLGKANSQSLLPEGSSVFRSGAHSIIKSLFADPANVPSFIEVLDNTELYISYMNEVAGWNNSLGYFVIPGDVTDEVAYYNSTIKPDLCETGTSKLKSKYVVFGNISDEREGGPLKPNSIFKLGDFMKDDKVVLFIVPDGWSSQNNSVEVSFNGWNQLFFTHTGLNNTTGVKYDSKYDKFKGIQHNSFYSADCKSIVMFFEDKGSDSDTDFNDIIFTISDNNTGSEVAKIRTPKYSIKDEGGPVLIETAELTK